ncbi:unnamed protein product [Ceratitis capitata]|uniref:(Mediterranean fruit fly) hypothetical protein n=1 Tax=Ceratitis capitata TaxID=7213 RepID=A0A811V5N6_CERCA|nr:unnamed protein product [Ceratitis capitata]
MHVLARATNNNSVCSDSKGISLQHIHHHHQLELDLEPMHTLYLLSVMLTDAWEIFLARTCRSYRHSDWLAQRGENYKKHVVSWERYHSLLSNASGNNEEERLDTV